MFTLNRFSKLLFSVLFDITGISLAFISAYYLRVSHLFPQTTETPLYPYMEILPFVVVISIFCLQFLGVYRYQNRPVIDIIPNIFMGTGFSGLILILITFVFKTYPFSRIIVFLFWCLGFMGLCAWRFLGRWVLKRFLANNIGVSGGVIVGSSVNAIKLAEQLDQPTITGIKILGFITEEELPQKELAGYPILGTVDDIETIIRSKICQDIFVVTHKIPPAKFTEWAYLSADYKIRLNYLPDIQELILRCSTFTELNGVPLIVIEGQLFRWRNRFLKRLLDLVISMIVFIITAPLFIIVGLLIRFDPRSPGPVFFKQTRIGRRGKPFNMYKFRSMVINSEQIREKLVKETQTNGPLFKMKDDPRITRIGKILRRFSLDELPQAINVLLNDMSWVGPRPPIPSEVAQYEDWQMKRLQIQPGITGLWQVSGRSDLPFVTMVNLDIYYIEHWSLWMDIKILLKTFQAVLKGTGAY